MEKSAIITVTSGDFEYIDEWIEHHHNLGVDLFLIGYNGPSEKLHTYKQYDYVRYIDFSYNDSNLETFKYKKFSDWITNTNMYSHKRMQQIETLLLNYLKWLYQDIHYAIVIDTDEFINIKNDNYCTIGDFLSEHFPANNSSVSIDMNFATGNNLIYKENKPVLERFTEFKGYNDFGQCSKKVIIDLFHADVKEDTFVLNSPHSCIPFNNSNLSFDDIELQHFWTKSLEEWIEKLNPDIDQDYFNRFRGHIFKLFFENNTLTEDKIEAIPELLKKYHIEYDPTCETNTEFVELYKKIHKKDEA